MKIKKNLTNQYFSKLGMNKSIAWTESQMKVKTHATWFRNGRYQLKSK